MSKNVYIHTFGCQMNVHDSEKMLGILRTAGYESVADAESADLIVFNTCAIRDKAEQKFYSQLGRVKALKQKTGVKIAVAGCVAQDAGEDIFARAPHVDYVIGTRNIHNVARMLTQERAVFIGDEDAIASGGSDIRRNSRHRAWVSIMHGCNNYCSYCIVPYTRGPEVSRPSSDILREVADLRELGYKDITLLGQNVNSYRSDLDFPGLLEKVSAAGIPRVRFVTSHPRDFGVDLIRKISQLPAVCEHLHLPLQSGSNRVLAWMNRGYSYEEYWEKVQQLREAVPGVAVTTDLIVGFPGEQESDFEETERAVREVCYDGIFAFKYSPRRGTKAAGLPDQVPDPVKTGRIRRLLSLQEAVTLEKNQALVGRHMEILVEGPSESDPETPMGRTRTNKIVTFSGCSHSEGELISVKIEKARHHSLHGACVCCCDPKQ